MTFAVNSCTPKCENLPYTPRSYEKPIVESTKEVHNNMSVDVELPIDIYFWGFILLLVIYLRVTRVK